jgi:DNA processing protein
MKKEGKDFLVSLSCFRPFGPVSLKKLKNRFHSWEKAFNASPDELVGSGITEKIAAEFIEQREKIIPEKIIKELAEKEISTISIEESAYPKMLKNIFHPPFLLFYRGNISIANNPSLAVVGARKCTYYGQQAVERLIPPLAQYNILIVSGLALGIDAAAQEEIIKAGGHTIAVLGTGVEREGIYPEANWKLAEKIVAGGGAIISEFPPRTAPLRQNFPQRNRIIAGLAQATLVIEANRKSGSLITARYALEEGREVMAVPGNIFSPTSAGPNNLIKAGAKPITSSADILESYGIYEEELLPQKGKNLQEFSAVELEILKKLSSQPTSFDDIVRTTKLDTKIINSTLTILELKKAVKNTGGGKYIINF